MAEFKTLPIDKIMVPERLRAVEEDHALAISASIVEHGLINPITVRKTPRAKRPYTLVAGAHRLRAVELLDEGEIEAFVIEGDADDGRLLEITENLFRNELSALDRATFVLTYREVWERKFGKIRPGNRANLAQLFEDEAAAGFSVHVAERLGLSVRAVKRAQYLGQRLDPQLRKSLRGTPAADNQSELLRLAGMEPERQRRIAVSYAETRDLSGAIALTDMTAKAKADRSEKSALLERLLSTWSRADDETKAAFLKEIGAGAGGEL